jgi:hypothetical protein
MVVEIGAERYYVIAQYSEDGADIATVCDLKMTGILTSSLQSANGWAHIIYDALHELARPERPKMSMRLWLLANHTHQSPIGMNAAVWGLSSHFC